MYAPFSTRLSVISTCSCGRGLVPRRPRQLGPDVSLLGTFIHVFIVQFVGFSCLVHYFNDNNDDDDISDNLVVCPIEAECAPRIVLLLKLIIAWLMLCDAHC